MKTCTLERRFFKTLSDGSSEFDWVLDQLGIPSSEACDMEEIEIQLAGED